MDKQFLSTFAFEHYKIHNIQYFVNDNFYSEEPIDIEYSLGVNIELHDDKKNALVHLNLEIFNEAEKNNYPFTLNMSITGAFSTQEDIKPEAFMDFCKINATAILYPYLRSAVTDITKVANEQPLVMPLINVYNLIKSIEQSTEQNKASENEE